MDDDTSVRVAVRIRPQISRELIEMSRICTSVTPGEPQVWIGSDKAFTFDYVFDTDSVQDSVYETCIQQLIEGCFEGYNATVLAYGQTGSGKTYTMGTGFDVSVTDDELGIIPRAVDHLFDGIEERRQQAYDNNQPLPDFKIHCQFLELYNEEIVDLFDTAKDASSKGRRSNIRIHEDSNGCIYTVGVTTRVVTSKNETLQCLKVGALSRTTASTQMNAQSSRSHAIFTLHIKQLRAAKIKDPDMEMDTVEGLDDFETLTAKFHFVDLAGSERLKRTGATGERAKEGISINCGLLALGNVISALGDLNKLGNHVPYRDSKLTRLLQDSLGGNSRTTMIACISPSDSDFMETLNTLKYANRARNIKNKIVANQDKTSKTLSVLRNEIQRLQLELMEYKQGKRVVNRDGEESINDMYHENTMLQSESNNLRIRVKAMQETIEQLTVRNTELLAEKATGGWISTGGETSDMTKMVHTYIKEVEELRVKLMESENICQNLRKNASRGQNRLSMSPLHSQAVAFSGMYDVGCDSETSCVNGLLQEAKKDLAKMIGSTKSPKQNKDNNEEAGENNGEYHQEEELDSDVEEGQDDQINEESSESEEEDAIDEQYQSDLAELTCEISIKQRLIEELERSQKRLQTMRHQYEDKLIQLQNKIKATQEERDKVLANLGTVENLSDEKVKRIKGDYERKLGELTGELKKVQSAKKEHARLLKSQMQYESQMRNLRTELGEMKKAKVRLMNKIKDESSKHKEVEQKRNREIAQLKKESRVRENQIRTLEAEKKLKEAVLKRKQEEVQALRRNAKPMSDRVAGRFGRGKNMSVVTKNQVTFSPKIAKTKWQRLENEITKLVLNKKTVTHWEKEMERRLQEREELSRSLDRWIRKRDSAMLKGSDETKVRDITDQIDALQTNIDYVQENIADCQARIMQLEESKDGQDFIDTNSLVTELNAGETKYLIEKLLNMTISQSTLATQREACLKEAEAKIIQVEQNNTVHKELLEHMLNQQNMDLYSYTFLNDDEPSGESAPTSRSASPSESLSVAEVKDNNILSSSSTDSLRKSGRVKARRRTAANSEELLFGMPRDADATESLILSDIKEEAGTGKSNNVGTSQNRSLMGSLTSSSSYSMSKSDYARPAAAAVGRLSPRMGSKFGHFSSIPNPTPQSANDPLNPTPPISPTPSRKLGRDENVFSRLTNSTTSYVSAQPNVGSVSVYSGKPFSKSAPLYCCFVAEGHSKAVLSVVATDQHMFTASKDRTVKVWDLQRGQEIMSLGSHPNNVCVVRYCERTRQVFTASSAYVKVWDLRESASKCVKTLYSSGSTCNGHISNSTHNRVVKIPAGEHQINDLIVDTFGTSLFTAAGNSVRIWDLRRYASIGKLNGNNQAAVTCMAVSAIENRNYQLVTGSKDHYIKVFEVPVLAAGIHQPRYNLEPPHYDGIVSLAVTSDSLFSGSRDMCIKKWDLNTFELKQSLNQAHKDWVCGLCVIPGEQSILSCCRGGFIRQWSTDSCAMLGEMKAHEKPINDITRNRTSIFTASEDTTVRIWKPRGTNDSPDISECG